MLLVVLALVALCTLATVAFLPGDARRLQPAE